MSAVRALNTARAVGIRLRVDGDDLELSAEAPPTQAVLDLLANHKADILRLLRPSLDGWLAEDWQTFFDERAAIYEFDGGLRRSEAEARAFECCVVEWLNRNPAPSPPGYCAACGGGECFGDPLVPFGNDTSGHAWLHRACWPAWYRAREVEAIEALSEMSLKRGGPDAYASSRRSRRAARRGPRCLHGGT
jgi:hypothetical protein